jgi:hypothetical protein
MEDYKEMYLKLFNETTKAIQLLQAAQQKSEELYILNDANIDPTLEISDKDCGG